MYRCHIWRILTPSVPCPGSGACSCSTSRAWWPGAAAPRWTDSPPWRTSRTTPPPSSGCAGQHYITPFLALLIYGFNFSNILWFDHNPGWQVTINLHWSMMMAFWEKYFYMFRYISSSLMYWCIASDAPSSLTWHLSCCSFSRSVYRHGNRESVYSQTHTINGLEKWMVVSYEDSAKWQNKPDYYRIFTYRLPIYNVNISVCSYINQNNIIYFILSTSMIYQLKDCTKSLILVLFLSHSNQYSNSSIQIMNKDCT